MLDPELDYEEGGWTPWVAPDSGFTFQCPDCNLIHELQFTLAPDNTLLLRARKFVHLVVHKTDET